MVIRITVSRMADPPIFIDVADTDVPDLLPTPPITNVVKMPAPKAHDSELKENRYGHLLPHGTNVAKRWDEDWIQLVVDAEKNAGYAICGAKRAAQDFDAEEDMENPLLKVCKRRAGWNTDHSGEGRCISHAGNMPVKTGQFSMLKNRKISSRVEEFFENEQLTDIRTAMSINYAAMDAMLDEDEDISKDTAKLLSEMSTRAANMVKQHNDIQEKRRISIEVPEFMAWAEFFYELSVRHLQEAGGDVGAFLRDAQQFYDRTVTITVGAEARRNRLGESNEIGDLSDEGVSRPVIEVP